MKYVHCCWTLEKCYFILKIKICSHFNFENGFCQHVPCDIFLGEVNIIISHINVCYYYLAQVLKKGIQMYNMQSVEINYNYFLGEQEKCIDIHRDQSEKRTSRNVVYSFLCHLHCG